MGPGLHGDGVSIGADVDVGVGDGVSLVGAVVNDDDVDVVCV